MVFHVTILIMVIAMANIADFCEDVDGMTWILWQGLFEYYIKLCKTL